MLQMLLFGIAAVFIFLIRVVPLWSIKNSKPIRVADAKSGIVRLEGTASAAKPLKSPGMGEDCIYYRTTVWHRYRYGEGGLFNERIVSEEKGTEFVIEDESGRIAVGGRMPSMLTNRKTVSLMFDCGKEPPAELSATMKKKLESGATCISLTGSKGYFSLTENTIPNKAKVIVVGEVEGGKVSPYVLTDEKFYRIEANLMYELVALGFAAFFGFSLGFAFILINYYG